MAAPALRARGRASAAALLAGIAILASPQQSVALTVVVATALALVALRGVASAAMAIARRAPRVRWVEWRMAIANLHRPGAPTPSVVISLGLGLAVIVALTLVDVEFARRNCARALQGETPNFYFLDVRSAQIAAVPVSRVRRRPAPKIVEAPMMRGRIVRIGDAPRRTSKAKESVAWVLEGDRGVTYAGAPPDGSESSRGPVVAGRLWGPAAGVAGGGSRRRARAEDRRFVTVNVLGRN